MRNKLVKSVAAGVCAFGLGAILAQAAAPAAPQGAVTAKIFLNIGGGVVVNDLTGNAKFPDSPDLVQYPTFFELYAGDDINTAPADDVLNNMGAQMVGYFYPDTTGDYTFYLSADDGANLYLSTDDNPANKKLIAQEAGWSGKRNYTGVGGGSTVEAKLSLTFTGTEWPTKDTGTGGAKITLTQGRAYYIEALVKEGGGGDNLSVSLDGNLPIPGSMLSSFDKTTGPLTIVTQPQSRTVNALDPVTFSVVVDGTPPYTFQWQKDGVAIAGETNASFTITRTSGADNGTKYKVVVTGAQGGPLTSSEATLNVNTDASAPTVVSVTPSADFVSVAITFSEPLDPTTAGTAANYALSGGITVSAATLSPAPNDNRVTLTTSRMAPDTQLTLTVNNVKDLAGNTIAANTVVNFKSASFATGWATYQRWDNANGDPGDITAFATAIADGTIRAPDVNSAVQQFGGAWGAADNYSSRVFAWFTPPSSGNYVFFLSSDDQSNLYLSTDDTPANKKLIAQESGWSNQYQWATVGGGSVLEDKRSDTFAASEWTTPNTITLTAGQRYYIEILQDEGGGGDGSDATFIKVGDPDPAQTVDGMFLKGSAIGTYLNPNGASVNITRQPANTTILESRTATLSVAATGTSAYGTNLNYQWQKAAPGSTTFADITGAVAASYTTPVLQLADTGTKYRVNISVPTLTVTSSEAAVTVNADQAAPVISKAKASSVQNLIVTFDEPLDKTTAETLSNYALSDGVTITAATLNVNSVLLVTSGLTVQKSYTLTVGGVKDLFNNTLPAGTTFQFVANVITYADVILADSPIGFYRFEETTGQTTKNFGTAGTSADGLYMAGGGPDDSVPANVVVGPGPRPGAFLGFDPNNNAVLMDGPTSQLWIDTQKQFLNNLRAFTLEYWVKPANRVADPTTFGNRVGLVGQNDAVEYGFITPTTIQIWTAGGGALDTTYSFPDNEWHHIATIADGRNIKNYFDGVLVGTGGTTTSGYGSSTFNVHIGGGGVYDATGNFFTGQFDEVAIFDKAIPADRVVEHFKAGKEGGEAPEPIAPTFTNIRLVNGQVTVEWTGGGTLQAAPSLTGPWQDVTGATSPYTFTADQQMLFGRIRQ